MNAQAPVSDERLANMIAHHAQCLRRENEYAALSNTGELGRLNAEFHADHHAALTELSTARRRLAELEAGVRKWASECAECEGKGYVYDGEAITGRGPDDVLPNRVRCEQCEDIRALLPAAPYAPGEE